MFSVGVSSTSSTDKENLRILRDFFEGETTSVLSASMEMLQVSRASSVSKAAELLAEGNFVGDLSWWSVACEDFCCAFCCSGLHGSAEVESCFLQLMSSCSNDGDEAPQVSQEGDFVSNLFLRRDIVVVSELSGDEGGPHVFFGEEAIPSPTSERRDDRRSRE